MKSDVFYWVLNLSVHGSLVCLLLLLLRRVRRLPRRAVYPLWIGAALRLTVPFAPAVPWSFLHLLKQLGARTVRPPSDWLERFPAANVIQAADSYFPVVYRTDVLKTLFETCALIWLIGVAACLLTMTALYVMSRMALRDATPLRPGVWASDKVVSPGLFGILHPKILVPPGTEGKLLDYVERHERIHRRRLDNLWRVAALTVCCLHWFNPLVWLCLKAFFADMELSCDEAVLRALPDDSKKEYAMSLLSVAKGQDLFVSAFGGATLRLRVERVLSYRRLSAAAGIAFSMLTGALLATLAFG